MTRADSAPRLGRKLRALRRRQGLTQARLAEQLGISASYLNLIENDKRPLPAHLLVQLGLLFDVDLNYFATDSDARLVSELFEVLSDPLFERHDVTSAEVRELVSQGPGVARALRALYTAYRDAEVTAETLAARLAEDHDAEAMPRGSFPAQEVTDLVQRHRNYFPELEAGAEDLWSRLSLDPDGLYVQLVEYLDRAHKVRVRIVPWDQMPGTLRAFQPHDRVLAMSELLPTRSRKFALAYQVALLEQREALGHYALSPELSGEASRALCLVTLANYFASAVMMPYEPFRLAAKQVRYDIDVLGRRFRLGFEQVCHRLTTLRRPGAEGVPFHMIRIDVAGNVSKRFSASGMRFPRFSGGCPRWSVFHCFRTPGLIRTQVEQLTDGSTFFNVARTIQRDSGGYHAPQPVMAVGIGCPIEHAHALVYADGLDLEHIERAIVPIGVTCRSCERTDCDQRAHPSIRQPLQVDENRRGASPYARHNG